jgi:predicted alpha-1,6-mannanase (GH76 family)
MLGARLFIMTQNTTFVTNAKRTYDWMKANLVTSGKTLSDGLDASQNCAVSTSEFSYNIGTLVGALAWLAKATGDATYLNEISSLLPGIVSKFTQNSVVTDTCEPNCSPDQVQPKGTMIRGLGYAAAITSISQDKQLLQDILAKTTAAMLKTCDNQYACGNDWLHGTQGSNFHYEVNALELVNAQYSAVTSVNLVPDNSKPQNKNSQLASTISAALAVFGILLF